jgi:hypothetical protein
MTAETRTLCGGVRGSSDDGTGARLGSGPVSRKSGKVHRFQIVVRSRLLSADYTRTGYFFPEIAMVPASLRGGYPHGVSVIEYDV